MDTIQAAVANFVLQDLDNVTNKRISNSRLYDEALADLEKWVTLPPRRPKARQVFHTYVVQVERRNELTAFLSKRGVEAKIHYPIPIHLQKPCRQMGYKEGDFPVCEKQTDSILSLPIHQHLVREQIFHVAGVIREFYFG